MKKKTALIIPASVKDFGTIPETIENIKLLDGRTEISERTFSGCSSLTSATYKGITYSYENIKDLYKATRGY